MAPRKQDGGIDAIVCMVTRGGGSTLPGKSSFLGIIVICLATGSRWCCGRMWSVVVWSQFAGCTQYRVPASRWPAWCLSTYRIRHTPRDTQAPSQCVLGRTWAGLLRTPPADLGHNTTIGWPSRVSTGLGGPRRHCTARRVARMRQEKVLSPVSDGSLGGSTVRPWDRIRSMEPMTIGRVKRSLRCFGRP